jgi:hypothetical protein
MQTQILINWWPVADVPRSHRDELNTHAIGRISEMTQEGYTSGELIADVYDTTNAHVDYAGLWSLVTTQ